LHAGLGALLDSALHTGLGTLLDGTLHAGHGTLIRLGGSDTSHFDDEVGLVGEVMKECLSLNL
jgi:hypothetical protein